MARGRQEGFDIFTGLKGNKNNVQLEGFDEIIKHISQMGDQMKTNVIRGIIRQSMKPIAEAIKSNAPIRSAESHQGIITRKRKDGTASTKSKVGNLRDSIGVRTFATQSRGITGYAGINNGKVVEADDNLHREKDGWYGWFVERGTKYQSKNAFISRSAAATVPMATNNLEQEITKYIVKNAQKLGLEAK